MDAVANGTRARDRLPLLALGGAVVLMAIAFLPHLRGDFVWDDRVYILNNPRLRGAHGAWELLTRPFAMGGAVYRPLSTITFWLQVQTSGYSMTMLRLVNVLMHLCTGLVLGAWLRKLGVQATLAMLLTWGFLVHPGATEAAMFVNARHDLLGTLCALGALASWPKAGSVARRYLAPTVLVGMAVACKESFVVLPVLCAFEAARTGPPLRWPALAPVGAILAFFALRQWLHIPSSSDQLHASLLSHLSNYATLVLHYGALFVTFRNGLTVEHFAPLGIAGTALVYAALATLCMGLTWLHRRGVREARWATFGLGWFLLAMAPNVLAVPWLGQYANRYGYFPAVGLWMMVAAMLESARKRLRAPLLRPLTFLALLALLGLALATTVEASAWESELRLFGNDMESAPDDSRVLYHYGVAIADRQGCAKALPLFIASTEREPRYVRAWHNVTGCLINSKRFPEAVTAGRRALELDPRDPGNLFNLGIALASSGQLDEGIALLERAVAADPTNGNAQRTLEDMRAARHRSE